MRRALFTVCLTLICFITIVLRLPSSSAAATTNGTVPAENLVVSSGNIYEYTEGGQIITERGGINYPTGLALDAAENLYVASGPGTSPGILVYSSDYQTLIATLTDPMHSLGVAVDVSTGIVAATNVDMHAAESET